MLATFAFDVCHDVYRAAREVLDAKIPTLNAEVSGKYQWHPDRMPRLAEFVCDFARAGERALGDDSRTGLPAGEAGFRLSSEPWDYQAHRRLGAQRIDSRQIAKRQPQEAAEDPTCCHSEACSSPRNLPFF